MNNKFSILKTGSIYFFYRPKIEKNQEVQRFFIILHPEKQKKCYLLIVGKKHLPESGRDNGYFLFVDKVSEDKKELLQSLGEKHYRTTTRGERTLPSAQPLAEGKYLLSEHENHTHFIYQINSADEIEELQEEFNLKKEDDYLIVIKNPKASSPAGAGLSSTQKPSYPLSLQKQFANYQFISLNSAEFLDYKGSEILLIPKSVPPLNERYPNLQICLEKIKKDNLIEEFKKISLPKTLTE